jgi:hypothetical protein
VPICLLHWHLPPSRSWRSIIRSCRCGPTRCVTSHRGVITTFSPTCVVVLLAVLCRDSRAPSAFAGKPDLSTPIALRSDMLQHFARVSYGCRQKKLQMRGLFSPRPVRRWFRLRAGARSIAHQAWRGCPERCRLRRWGVDFSPFSPVPVVRLSPWPKCRQSPAVRERGRSAGNRPGREGGRARSRSSGRRYPRAGPWAWWSW